MSVTLSSSSFPPTATRHFLTGTELTPKELYELLELAEALKRERAQGIFHNPLAGKTLALLFEKPSLRTHMSFTIAMQELGGRVVDSFSFNRKKEEPEDVGRVLAGYCHAIMLRTHEHSVLDRMASKIRIPLINGLSDTHHPCQILADLLTLKETFRSLKGLKVAYIGDGNNILHSLLLLLPMLGMHISYACPSGYEPDAFVVKKARLMAQEFGGAVTAANSPQTAVRKANAIYTDVWTSMGFEAETTAREEAFRNYQLNSELYGKAAPGALVMHCLPMLRGKEITDDMAEHENSVLFRQSENRLHAQKALLLYLLGEKKLPA